MLPFKLDNRPLSFSRDSLVLPEYREIFIGSFSKILVMLTSSSTTFWGKIILIIQNVILKTLNVCFLSCTKIKVCKRHPCVFLCLRLFCCWLLLVTCFMSVRLCVFFEVPSLLFCHLASTLALWQTWTVNASHMWLWWTIYTRNSDSQSLKTQMEKPLNVDFLLFAEKLLIR